MASGFIRGSSTNIAEAQVINATTGLGFVGTVTVFVTVDTNPQVIGTVGSGVAIAKGNGVFQYIPSAAESTGTVCLFTFTGANAIPASSQYWTISDGQSTAVQIASNPNITPLRAVNLITSALNTVGILGAGETASGDMATDGFRRLNNMMGTLAIQPKTIPVIAREVYPLVAGQGGVGNEYTMGPGGDFDTTRPNEIQGAGLLLGSTSPLVETPLAVLTDQSWQSLQIKNLTSPQPTAVYYNQTFSSGLGTINLWPVPDNALNSLVLYRSQQLTTFTSLTATYYVPNGYDEMLEYQLAIRLAGPYQRTLPSYVLQMAVESLALVKRANYRIFDMPVDPAFTRDHRGGYNILSGQGGG
jgi:hypothetical protein